MTEMVKDVVSLDTEQQDRKELTTVCASIGVSIYNHAITRRHRGDSLDYT